MTDGGSIRLLWDRDDSAVVNIYGAAGQLSDRFTHDGSPVEFPLSLSGDTTLVTTTSDRYSISVVYNDVEIADNPDGRKRADLYQGGQLTLAPSPDDGFVSPTGASSGGGGGTTDSISRGTLYLKASVVDQDVSVTDWADGSGAPFALVLDTDKQTDAIPEWASETGGVYSITEQGAYIVQLAGMGTLTYDAAPDLAYIDMYHNDLSGVNYGWASDGSENSEAFTPAEVNQLQFGVKDSTSVAAVQANAVPISLAGLVGDNSGDLAGNPVLSLEARMAVTKLGSGPRYTESDLS